MSRASLLLALLDLGFVALLPWIFFRRDGKKNARWFATAAPYMLGIVLVSFALAGRLEGWKPAREAVAIAMEVLSVPLCAGSIALMAFTLGTHRIPIALWHQDNDAPRHIVTWGAYSRVRHPFYASFLLCLLGTVLALPHVLTALALVYALVALNLTAAREERRLAASEFGEEYRKYMARTGRFWPRFGVSAS
ncbi:MAG: methyltransferase family protein [Planctomycetota bacterium]